MRVGEGLRLSKGHGTENDFVLVVDPDGELELGPATVAALCDRRRGVGADGLIRVVRTAALPEGVPQAGEAEWFMNYRNGDGSIAEMCGNGVRVFVAFLVREALLELDEGQTVSVGTRAGVKHVRRVGHDQLSVDLGPWQVPGGERALRAGGDVVVHLRGGEPSLPGLSVDLGNPHVVVVLPDRRRLAVADLAAPPRVEPVPERGANVELVVAGLGDPKVGHLAMRVHERGVGETRSCGTGAAAAVLAARAWAGAGSPRVWDVDVPGGRLRVSVPAGAVLGGGSVLLSGPAVIIADFELDRDWIEGQTVRR